MRSKTFGDFVDKKKRENLKQLELLQKLLEKTGMKVDGFLESEDSDDPYIFCFAPGKNGSFEGIRIYKIGDQIAFRIQKESKTHPYGSAYPINVEQMFQDFLADEGIDEKKAGNKVIESVGKELKKFFEKSVEAERDATEEKSKSAGDISVRSTGTDYSALVFAKS